MRDLGSADYLVNFLVGVDQLALAVHLACERSVAMSPIQLTILDVARVLIVEFQKGSEAMGGACTVRWVHTSGPT